MPPDNDDLNKPKSASLGEKPKAEAKPVVDAAPKGRVETKPAAPVKDVAPAAAAKPVNGPDNDFGLERPDPADTKGWDDFYAKRYDAEQAYNAEREGAKPKAEAKPADAKPGIEKPAAAAEEKKPTEAKTEDEKPKVEDTKPDFLREAEPLNAEETFALGTRPEETWTRKQIVDEITSWRGEASTFRDVFKDTAEGVKTRWGPFLEELTKNPDLPAYLDQARQSYYKRLNDPDYAKFMDENEENYAKWRKDNPADKAPVNEQQTADQKRIAALEDALRGNEQRAALERQGAIIKAERESLWARVPVLAQDKVLWQAIYAHAVQTSSAEKAATGKSTYTLTQAVRDLWPLIERSQAAYASEETREKEAPVPVRAGGQTSGPGEQHARKDPDAEEKFNSTAEAVAAHLREHPEPI